MLTRVLLVSSRIDVRRSLSNGKNFMVLGDESTLKDLLAKEDQSKVLYFTAVWCPPCKMIAPVFEKMSSEFPQTTFVKIDVDDHNEAASQYKITSVPSFLFFQGSKLSAQVVGANESAIRNELKKLTK